MYSTCATEKEIEIDERGREVMLLTARVGHGCLQRQVVPLTSGLSRMATRTMATESRRSCVACSDRDRCGDSIDG